MGKTTNETFFVNVYRHGSGYMFGDNMIRHKTLDEAAKAVRNDLEYAGAMRMDIEERDYGKDKCTEIRSRMIYKR